MFLMIAVVMDRSSAALRESLKEANARGAALAESNRLLQEEMREREHTQERLIHAQKMEAAGRLASGVAHDFGNLLGLIQGYVQTGKRSASLEQALQSLAGVESAAKRAAAVSGKLLSFSRQDQTRPEVFGAAAALTQMQPMLRQLFDPTVTLTYPDAPSAQRIRFDRTQFELMVLNLAANAQHAMPEGGLFAMHAPHADGPVVLLFRDTGPGIPPEVQARIFDPFFTTKPAGQGTGLGLAVVKDLVEAAGGRVEVDSGPESGTTLRLEFPRHA
jgi:signal transduction histidine kinase